MSAYWDSVTASSEKKSIRGKCQVCLYHNMWFHFFNPGVFTVIQIQFSVYLHWVMMGIDMRVFCINVSHTVHQSFVSSFYQVHMFVSFYQLIFFLHRIYQNFPSNWIIHVFNLSRDLLVLFLVNRRPLISVNSPEPRLFQGNVFENKSR